MYSQTYKFIRLRHNSITFIRKLIKGFKAFKLLKYCKYS